MSKEERDIWVSGKGMRDAHRILLCRSESNPWYIHKYWDGAVADFVDNTVEIYNNKLY